MTFDPGNRLIVALDVPDRAGADALVARLDGASSWVKIGLELFIAEGPSIVRDYVECGLQVMLDLKLHDIPATVGSATARAAALGAGRLVSCTITTQRWPAGRMFVKVRPPDESVQRYMSARAPKGTSRTRASASRDRGRTPAV